MRLIDADALNLKLASLDNIARSPSQKALLGRVFYIVDQMPTVGGWISVKDRLPDIRGCYLVYRPNFNVIYPLGQATVCYFDGNVWYDDYKATEGLELHFSITHWMPLPEPPKEEK